MRRKDDKNYHPFSVLYAEFMLKLSNKPGPIGVFDSGYGGLTILENIRKALPEYDYLYLGDNARAPYGSRSFEVVYEFTKQAVSYLFEQGCHLVVLACNTASAKALRSIQQKDLPLWDKQRRVLGIIRPTVEGVDGVTQSRCIGLLGTVGTIQSESYPMEIKKIYPDIQVFSLACPMWVPLVENREYDKPGADYFVKQYLDRLLNSSSKIDTLILGCTHYPLLEQKVREYLPQGIKIIPQGKWVADSLKNYLLRHPEIDEKCTRNGRCEFLTTESEEKFADTASVFLKENIQVKHITMD